MRPVLFKEVIMVLDRIAEAAKDFERKTGFPPLSKFVETVDKLPDERRLRLILEVLVTAERVAKTAPELDKVINLIHEINSVPLERLKQLEKLLKRIEGIMKKAPQELLDFLVKLKEG